MKLKLFLDEDLHSRLAHALRRRGFDVTHAQELDRKWQSDPDQLLFAIRQERCIVSFNVKDFVILHNKYVETHQEHWGIIVSKQLPFKETMSRLLKLLGHVSNESMKNNIEFL